MSRSKKKSKKKSPGKLVQKLVLIVVLLGVGMFALGMLRDKDNHGDVGFEDNNEESIVYCYKCGNESLTGENICSNCEEEDNSNDNVEKPEDTEKPEVEKPKPEKPEDTEKPDESVKPEEPTQPEKPKPEKPKYKCVVCKQLVEQVLETSDGPACSKCIENVNSGMYTCINGYSDVCRGCSKCSPNDEE